MLKFFTSAILLAGILAGQTSTRIDITKIRSGAKINGTPTTGNCVSWVNSSTIGDAGAACGTGGGGGTGASQTSQLIDWNVTRTSATVLTFASNCLPASICNVNIGGIVTPFSGGPYTTTISNSGTGSEYIYISNTGTLSACVVTSSGTIGLAQTGGVAIPTCLAAPTDVYFIERWDVSSGALNSTGTALASYANYSPYPVAGTGIVVTPGQRSTIAADTTSVLRKFSCVGGPGTNLPVGATWGDICFDTTVGTPTKWVCSNLAGCTVAGDFKSF